MEITRGSEAEPIVFLADAVVAELGAIADEVCP
jgi:hypothetical protein